jgi:hypothetical protein
MAVERGEINLTNGLAVWANDLQPTKSCGQRGCDCRRRIRVAAAPNTLVPSSAGFDAARLARASCGIQSHLAPPFDQTMVVSAHGRILLTQSRWHQSVDGLIGGLRCANPPYALLRHHQRLIRLP